MLTVSQFDALAIDDEIEAGILMGGVCDERMRLRTVFKKKKRAEFVATYFGITVGRWVCLKDGTKLKWQI